MKYFMFLNHPKGESVYNVSKKREEILRSYLKSVETIEMEVEIRGEKYNATIDYTAFSNLANFDCFNCQDPCCADNPTIYGKKTREFILENLKEYNEKTKNIDILLQEGEELEKIIEGIKTEALLVKEEYAEAEVALCSCAYKPNNESTLCSLHSICLDKGMSSKEISEIKPLVCNLWPIDIICEDDLSMLYITVPDDFTTGFTIEDYYDTPCINKELSKTAKFRRKNPEGFKEEDYKPIIFLYSETIKNNLGERVYNKILNLLLEKELVFKEELEIKEEQLIKKIKK